MTAAVYRRPLAPRAAAVEALLAQGGEWLTAEIEQRLGFYPYSQLQTLYVRGLIARQPQVEGILARRWYHV